MRGRTLILDLDQCIIRTFTDKEDSDVERVALTDPSYMSLRGRMYHIELTDLGVAKGTGRSFHMWGVSRPHFKEFLLFAKSYFDVICVWTAGTKSYAEAIVDSVFHDIRMPDLVYDRRHLDTVPGGYHKPINKILSDPAIKDRVDIGRTFFVDDMGSNFITSPGNGIIIPEYNPAPRIANLMSDDIALLQLRQWLLRPEVANATDIRQVNKSFIFTTPLAREKDVPPLAESRNPWAMYSGISIAASA